MATLNASIELTDNMTKVFRSISSAMDGVINLFDQLDRETSDGLNNAELGEARRRVDEIRSAVAHLEVGIDEATRSQDNFTNSVRETEDQSNKLLDTLKTIVITYAGIQMVQSVMDTSTELINVEARLNNINDGAQTTAELMDKVYASANRSYAGFTDTASAVAKLAGQTGKLFGNTDQVIAFTELLNKSFAIGGTSAEGKASAMLQLTQAMSSGVLRGEEFNALNENAGQLVQIIADYMGVEKGMMKELASEGKITADIIKNAIFSAGEDIDKTFDAMPITFEDAKTRISNLALQMFEPMWKTLQEFINSDAVKKAIAGIAKAFQVLAGIVTSVLGVFVGAFNWIVDNWSTLGPLFVGIADAILVYAGATAYLVAQKKLLAFWEGAQKVASIASNAVTVAGIILSGYMRGATVAETNAKIVETGATVALTAAEYALLAPILLVIGAILAIIGAIYLVVMAYNYFTGASKSATGYIVGAFYWLYAGIYNIVMWIWNIFVEVAEFLTDVFNDPIYYVKALFGTLGKFILDIGGGIADGINGIVKALASGVEWMVNGAIDALNALISAYNNSVGFVLGAIPTLNHISISVGNVFDTSGIDAAKAEIDSWIGKRTHEDADYSDYKADYLDMQEYFDKGYAEGEKFDNWIGGLFDLTTASDELTEGLGDNFDYEKFLGDAGLGGDGYGESGVGDDIGSIAGDTASMADSLATTAEDLKYLVDVAKQNRVEQITSVDITIPVNMNNNISNGTDLTGAIDYMTHELTVKIGEAIQTSAQGVHS